MDEATPPPAHFGYVGAAPPRSDLDFEPPLISPTWRWFRHGRTCTQPSCLVRISSPGIRNGIGPFPIAIWIPPGNPQPRIAGRKGLAKYAGVGPRAISRAIVRRSRLFYDAALSVRGTPCARPAQEGIIGVCRTPGIEDNLDLADPCNPRYSVGVAA